MLNEMKSASGGENPEQAVQDPNIQPETPAPPPSDSKFSFLSSKLFLLGIFGLILLSSLLFGVYKLGRNSQKTPVSTTIETPTPTPIDETANWKTYNGGGYSIKYPSNVSFKQDRFYLTGDDNRKDTSDGFGPNLSILFRADSGTPLEVAKRELQQAQFKNVTVNNYAGVEVIDSQSGFDYYLSKTGGKVFRITFNSQDYSSTVSKENIDKMEKIANQMLSTLKFTNSSNTVKPTATPIPQINGASLENIKYSLPAGWTAVFRDSGLDIHPANGGYLFIKVYNYDGKTGRRDYYCQTTNFCTDSSTFTSTQIGNISGYKAGALDNSGGGPEYFGAKGNKFYIISTYSPPPPNDFDKGFQSVLNSLVF